MSIEARKEYLRAIRDRYKKAGRSQKTAILNEFCEVCGYARKYAIRILNGLANPRKTKPGPKVKYGPDVIRHLRLIWISMDQICSKKMIKALPHWLPFYVEPGVTDEIKKQLLQMSASSIDRHLKSYRHAFRKGLSATRGHQNKIKNKIPIQLIIGQEILKPGYIEADTVAHCGDSLSGYFINSLTMTDIYSCWTENRACWTKGQTPVQEQIKEIEKALPFSMTGFACDNGTEFLNYELLKYFRMNRAAPIEFTRRRPYKKNDNAHVEQKNWTHVRQIFGYERLEDRAMVAMMNEIYQLYWNPLHNFFIPSVRLIEKTRVGGNIKKKYDEPKTPYQRLLDSADLPQEAKDKLQVRYKILNPFELHRGLQTKLTDFKQYYQRQKLMLVG